jgi:hypothetical protein
MHFSVIGSDFVIHCKSYAPVKFAEYMDHFVVILMCDTALHFSSLIPLKLAQRLDSLSAHASITH